jgi:hypothetical protein
MTIFYLSLAVKSGHVVPMAIKRLIPITAQAKGTFDVLLHPLGMEDIPGEAKLGRMSIDKQFHGDLAGTSKGQMLTSSTTTSGSAAYVAVERFTGTLNGKHGSFSLHHTGIMNRGAQSLVIKVVPDSGTQELTGISGTLTITVTDGQHSYAFDYSIEEQE